MQTQINPELLQEWKKKGELIAIWRCSRCYKKVLFYKSGNAIIDGIYLAWVHDHEYCQRCEAKLKKNNNPLKKEKMPRINILIQRYEPRVEAPLILA